MILLSYDGSPDAQAAIDRVAQLMPGAQAKVLTVWEPFVDTLTRSGAVGVIGAYGDAETIDAANEERARDTAREGAERAGAAGLAASAQVASRENGIAHTILAAAAQDDADVIVMGTRGLSGVKSFLLGSVSHAVTQHSDRPVLVVPSAALGDQRRGWVDAP
jgi:nucleotide-binding universal stress UspA family protein